MDGGQTDEARAAETARRRRLFELLNQGTRQAGRVAPAASAAPAPAIEDFAEMARRSLAAAPETPPAPKPPRRRFWPR